MLAAMPQLSAPSAMLSLMTPLEVLYLISAENAIRTRPADVGASAGNWSGMRRTSGP